MISIRNKSIVLASICIGLLSAGLLWYRYWQYQQPQQATPLKQKIVTQISVEDFAEQRDEMVTLMQDQNPRVALQTVAERIKTDEALLGACHALMHEIGRAAYREYNDFGIAISYREELCNSGYIHGVIESAFTQSPEPLEAVVNACDAYDQASFVGAQCYHGIGHGLMFYTDNDLPRAIAACDGLSVHDKRANCANGVYMENFTTEQKVHTSAYLKKDDLFYPCPKQPAKYQAECYVYAPTYYLAIHKGQYAKALDWCQTATAAYRLVCVKGVGSQTVKENIQDPLYAEQVCMRGRSGAHRKACVEGMLLLYMSHHGSTKPAAQLCKRLAIDNKQACVTTVSSQIRYFNEQ